MLFKGPDRGFQKNLSRAGGLTCLRKNAPTSGHSTGREADVQLPEPRGRLDGRERAMFRAAERATRRGPRARTAASRPGRRRSAHHSEQTEDVNAPSCAPPELERSIEHAGIPADPKLERARADRLDQHESPGGRSGCLGVASSREARGCSRAGARTVDRVTADPLAKWTVNGSRSPGRWSEVGARAAPLALAARDASKATIRWWGGVRLTAGLQCSPANLRKMAHFAA